MTNPANQKAASGRKPDAIEGWSQAAWDEAWEAAEHDPALMPTRPWDGERGE